MTEHADIEETTARLASYRHVLRELVHLSAGHLALEPRFEVKALLGDHLHDDARAVAKLDARLAELGADAGAPDDELTALLDRAGSDYPEGAYGELKPSLIAALGTHLERLDPLLDEPGLRLMTTLLHRQERHVAELPAGRIAVTHLGGSTTGPPRELRVIPAPSVPARDAFVTIADDGAEPADPQAFFHALMNAELHAAERAARRLHESPELHVELAREAWDGVRHAQAIDRLMSTQLGCHWGELPVSFAELDPRPWRRALLDAGHADAARVLDWVLAGR